MTIVMRMTTITSWGAVFLTAVGVVGAADPGDQGANPSIPMNILGTSAVISAEVVQLRDRGGTLDALLRISHAYLGPSELAGKTFTLSISKAGWGNLGISPPPRQHEIGIWVVSRERGVIEADFPAMHSLGLVALPARDGIAANRFPEARAWAEAIEAAAKVAPGERINLLKRDALNGIHEVSAWAIFALDVANPEGIGQFFHDLIARDGFALGGQVTLDEVLCRRQGKAWLTSKLRREMLERWVRAKLPTFEAGLVLRRLDVSAQRAELNDETLLALVREAIANEGIPLPLRRHGFWIIGRIARKPDVGERLFAYMIEQIRGAKEREIRLGAAYAMKNFVPLDENRAKVVRDLRDRSEDAQLAKVLGEALERIKQ